jgi:hypothetical protein
MQHKEDHAWLHLEPAPDPRDCHDFKTVEEEDAGCCEMAPGGTCPYAGGKTVYTPRMKGDGLGQWQGDDSEGLRK